MEYKNNKNKNSIEKETAQSLHAHHTYEILV